MHRLEEESLLSLEEGTGRPAPPSILKHPLSAEGVHGRSDSPWPGKTMGQRTVLGGQEQLSRTGPHGLGLGVTGEALLQE